MPFPLRMAGGYRGAALLLVLLTFAVGRPCVASPPAEASIEVHNRDTYVPMPLKALTSKTIIDGPVAKTRITYRIENKNERRIEATVNLHVPENTVLTGFGYYYGNRFIPGKMYDKGEAWKIYGAVTSRGRDPGVMDRPTAQDYHAQVFPVEPGNDLTVILDLVQLVSSDADGAHFEVPITQGVANGNGDSLRPYAVSSEVLVRDHEVAEIAADFGANGSADERPVAAEGTEAGAIYRLHQTFQPEANWRLTVRQPSSGVLTSVFSRMVGAREGYYALAIRAPKELRHPRLVLRSTPGTRQSLPTRFNDTEAYSDLCVVGQYVRPQRLSVTVISDNARPIYLNVYLSGERVQSVHENPAAALWADKRIDALSQSYRRDFRGDIIRMSQRFMVISPFTALLAIPQEELDYYRQVLAKQKAQTNTTTTGGGGGDPYIEVKAPAEARRVVAVFPNGEVKELTYDTTRRAWDGRFDIPFGTPEGTYRVTVIVVHKDGTRTTLVLEYDNRLSAPRLVGNATTLRAKRGGPLRVSAQGAGVQRAVAVTPWGERVELSGKNGPWEGVVNIPADWPAGTHHLTLILLDGAHNRTEVTLDVDVE